MYAKCFSCGEDGVLYNSDQRCEVCCFCGVVNESSPLAELDSGANELTDPVTHTETKFKYGRDGKRQGISHRTTDCKSGVTKTGKLGKECLERIMASYGVSASTQQQAVQLYWDNLGRRFHNRDARALAAAVFLTVMRMEKRVVSFKELAELCDTPVKIIGRQFKLVQQNLIAKGHVVSTQPSNNETVLTSIEVYANKIPRDAPLNIPEVIKKALMLVEWLDACTFVQQWPPHLFALSVFFLSFKTVNVANCYSMELKDFNRMYNLCDEKVLSIPTFNKISPKQLVAEIIDVCKSRGANGLVVTQVSFFFVFDMVMHLKPLFEHKIPIEMRSTENDEAFKRFREEKAAQELREMHPAEIENDTLSVIDESEINEYILTDTELQKKKRMLEAGKSAP